MVAASAPHTRRAVPPQITLRIIPLFLFERGTTGNAADLPARGRLYSGLLKPIPEQFPTHHSPQRQQGVKTLAGAAGWKREIIPKLFLFFAAGSLGQSVKYTGGRRRCSVLEQIQGEKHRTLPGFSLSLALASFLGYREPRVPVRR